MRHSRSRLGSVAGVLMILLATAGARAAPEQQQPDPPDHAPRVAGISTAVTRFAGIPQRGTTLGRPGAPVRVAVYEDLACPICRYASDATIRRVIRRYVRSGRVALELRLLAFISPSSELGARGALAAGLQGAAWEFTTAVLANQGPETEPHWLDPIAPVIAMRLGLDVTAWTGALESDGVDARLARDERRSEDAHVRGVPAFVLRGPRGRILLMGDAGIQRFAAAYARVAPRPRPHAG